jgi:hypothetical protein
MASQDKFNEFVKVMFNLQLINKLYHWNTTSFARHKATDQFADSIDPLVDRFVEVYSGRYNIKPYVTDIMLNSKFITDDGIVDLLRAIKGYLEKEVPKFANDSELLNIRDELLAEINKMNYLLRLN